MEKQTENKMTVLTQEEGEKTAERADGLVITSREAEEYCAYKRYKKVAEISSGISRAELLLTWNSDVQNLCAQVEKYRLAAVKMPLTLLSLYGGYFVRQGVACDCVIGGTGETLTDIKAREAKAALRLKAKEITFSLAPSYIQSGRYAELRKEIKKLRWVARKATLKVWLDGKYPYAVLSKLARICAEECVNYISTPHFVGCEKLKMELFGGCLMEVTGVENLEDYKKMIGAGMGRILCKDVVALRTEWMKEVEEIRFPAVKVPATLQSNEDAEKDETRKQADGLTALRAPLAMPVGLLQKREERGEERAKKAGSPRCLVSDWKLV